MRMASVHKLADGKHQVRWRDAAGTQRKKTVKGNKVDANRYAASVVGAMSDGSYVDPQRARIKVGALASKWIERLSHVKPKTLQDYRSLLRNQVLPRWGSVSLDRITHADVAEWVAGMRAGDLSASRTRQAYHLLTGMLDDAVKDRRLPRNPAAGVTLPRLPTVERRYLNHDDVTSLAEACGSYRALVLTLAYCGLRWGEATALRVRHVDLTRRRLTVVEAVTDVGGVMMFGSPKTHQQRVVPVPRFLVDELRDQVADKGRDDLVFTSPRGKVLRLPNFRRQVWDRACACTGLTGVTPHTLRHTSASMAIASGASIKAVQAMLGHGSATLTLDRYGHLFGEELDGVADRLDAARQDHAPLVRRSISDATPSDHGAAS
jgi:integrase